MDHYLLKIATAERFVPGQIVTETHLGALLATKAKIRVMAGTEEMQVIGELSNLLDMITKGGLLETFNVIIVSVTNE